MRAGACLDVACGGGDLTFALARLVGRRGRVAGVDLDRVKLSLARDEAAARGVGNAIADALVAEGIATTKDIAQLIDGLDRFVEDPDTLVAFPRVFQVWGRRLA